MTGNADWATIIFVVTIASGAASTVGSIVWVLRGMKAELNEKIMTTAQIVTDKIGDSRHFLRNEMHGELAKLENEFQTGLGKIENEMSSLASKLDMHRAEDAVKFQEHGERLARLEAAE